MSLIEFGWFESHSKLRLPFKIDCDALTDRDIKGLAEIVRRKFTFGEVYGIPRGGLRLALALRPYATEGPPLIVDDVLTTGQSMAEALHRFPSEPCPIGVVIVTRGEPFNWVWPILTVNAWTQENL